MTTGADPLAFPISYNAANQSYTVSGAAGGQTFRPADIDPTQSSAGLTTYKVTSGDTTDFLSLTTTGTGAGQTRYVAGGFWQRQVNGSSAVNGYFTAFAYGIRTPDASVPRSGAASYGVNLLGARSFETQLYALSGTGTMHIDFSTGAMAGNGRFGEVALDSGFSSGQVFVWQARALLSSGSNSFAGSLAMDNHGGGELHGQLFGPAAEELGASFSMKNNPNTAVVGTLFGARTSSLVNQSTRLDLTENPTFYSAMGRSLSVPIGSGTTPSSVGTAPAIFAVYRPKDGIRGEFYRTDGTITQPILAGGTQLSYTEFAEFRSYLRTGLQLDRTGPTARLDAVLYGHPTTASSLPRTGSATFIVLLNGGVAEPNVALASLNGTGSLTANLASGAISTLGSYTLRSAVPGFNDTSTGTQLDSGAFSGTATLSSTANFFAGPITFDGTAKDFSGQWEGQFFGPAAEEFGAVFRATGGSAVAIGSLHGQRGGTSTSGSQTPLGQLTEATELQTSNLQFIRNPAVSPVYSTQSNDRVTITYDPVANSYRFASTGVPNSSVPLDGRLLTPAMRNAGASTTTFDVYTTAEGPARVFRAAADNPAIVLSYTSFAQLAVAGNNSSGQAVTADAYVVFGGRTPSFQMPTTGTATYSGVVYGNGYYSLSQKLATLTGTSALTINFATGNAETILSLTAREDVAGLVHALGNFSYSGALAGFCPACGSNEASLRSFIDSNRGNMHLVFFGPNAAEFGGTFDLTLNEQSGLEQAGSFFAGATVGRKN